MPHNIHRIGGAQVGNLRLKQQEMKLQVPGISVNLSEDAESALLEARKAFKDAIWLQTHPMPMASTSIELIRAAGFDMIHVPSRRLPNHARIIHPSGIDGFSDENLEKLALAFRETTLENP